MTDGVETQERQVLGLVDSSVGELRMQRPLDDITARGRGLRRRRRAITGAAVAGTLAASLAVAVPLASTGTNGDGTLSAHGQVVNVDMAGWSVHTNANSTVTVTLHQLFGDTTALRAVLHQAGINAIVREIKHNDPSIGCAIRAKQLSSYKAFSPVKALGDLSYVIAPAAMPSGSVLEILVYDIELPDPFSPTHADPYKGRTLTVTMYASDPGPCVPALAMPPAFITGQK